MRRIASLFLSLVLVCTLCIPAFASFETSHSVPITSLREAATSLLTELLERQFEANKSGSTIYTDDILSDTPGTELYKQYLYWYSGKCTATQEYWTDYEYNLNVDSVDGNTIIFVADLKYGRTCSKYQSEAYGFKYQIDLAEHDGKLLISYIDSDEMNFYGFKNRITGGTRSNSLGVDTISPITKSTLDAMITDYANMKAAMNAMEVNAADVIDMETSYEAYLETADSDAAARATTATYAYERERGRRYADLYYTESGRNTCFENFDEEGGDCTNWVSQCVWAGYGGWTDGDSVATMTANIAARKRMQPSNNIANWSGHANGAGDAWANVTAFWNLVVSNPSIGPRGTDHYDGVKWSTSGMQSTEVVTGQVLQLRNGSSGRYAHSVFVTGGTNDSFANIKITQHSPFNRIMLDELIDNWGGTSSCYMRQLKFSSANFNS